MRNISISAVRKANGLTQRQLAEKLGVNPSAVGLWEIGRANPKLDNLKKMAVILKCTVDDLVRDEEKECE